MKIKYKDAKDEAKVDDFKFHKQRKQVSKIVNRATEERFRMCANKEAELEWKETKNKLDKKIKELE